MRRGNNTCLLMDDNGILFGFSTGSDACSEHECGSSRLQATLCAGASSLLEREEAALIKQLRAQANPKGILSRLFPGKPVSYPQLKERKTLNHNLDKLTLLKGTHEGRPVAVFGYSPLQGALMINHPELRFNKADQEVAGAWDERSFAIAVRGEKLVSQLEEFARAVKAGDGIFAGTFLDSSLYAGVILARQSMRADTHQAAIENAPADFESGLRLKARSRLDEFYALRRASQEEGRGQMTCPGHLWPVWKDQQVDGEVLYALNPYNGVDAAYWGPYDFEQLVSWMQAEKKFKLIPVRAVAEADVA